MNKQKQIPEQELIDLLLKKESKGLALLYDNYSATFYGVAMRMLEDEALAEEVLQETLLKIRENISQYNPVKGRLSAWMIQVVRAIAREKMHSSASLKKFQYSSMEHLLSKTGPETPKHYNPETKGLQDVVNEMDQEYRQILYLLFFAGFNQSEVALKLNIPLGTVKTRSRMAIMKLRNYLDKFSGGQWK